MAGLPPRACLDELTARAQRVIAARAAERATSSGERREVAGAASAASAAAPDAPLVLGIDPGTATMGYGLVRGTLAGDGAFEAVAYGVFETPAGEAMPQRLLALYRGLRALIQQYQPTQGAVEKLFFGRNTTTAISVGQARGVALLALAEADIPVFEYTAVEVKHSMAGFGRAEKTQMQRMVQALLGMSEIPRPDDAADALAIALCHGRLAAVRAMGLR